jgi:hypothetical protein
MKPLVMQFSLPSCHFIPLLSKYSSPPSCSQTPSVYQNYWVLQLVHCPGVKNYNMMFRKLDLFPSLREERKMLTVLGPLERANLSHWTDCHKPLSESFRPSVCVPPLMSEAKCHTHMDTGKIIVFFYVF